MKSVLLLTLVSLTVAAQPMDEQGGTELKVLATADAVPKGVVLPEGFSFTKGQLALAPDEDVDPGVAVRWSVVPPAKKAPTTGNETQLYRCGKAWCVSLATECRCSGTAPPKGGFKEEQRIPSVQGFVLPKLKGRVWWVPSAGQCPPCRAP